MRDALAERLLANVMEWTPADIARERPILQALALLKYDEYQQFSPGMRFVESLALWLEQFEPAERQHAYNFIRSRLIFLSEAEMAHFAAILYPDFLRPILLARAAEIDGNNAHQIARVAKSPTFTRLQSRTLFFGLSDGARIDQFRRSYRELSHEQIFPSYELPDERVPELRAWLSKQGNAGPAPALVLIDDFAGSGTSYVRVEDGKLKGKIPKFLRRIAGSEQWKSVVSFPETKLVIALYVATAQALHTIDSSTATLKQEFGADVSIVPVQILDASVRITPSIADPFVALIEKYYDDSLQDEHTEKGGTGLKYGFAACGLPLVLHHNTPNNSLLLLWVEGSDRLRPLFQRFSRHRREQ